MEVDTFGTPTVTVSLAQPGLFNGVPGVPNSVTATIDDFNPVAAGNLSGEVYNDTNFDGKLDNGESGIANVLVYLDSAHTQNGSFNVAEDPFIFTSAAAAQLGDYTFFGLANSSYNVFQVPPAGFDQTQPSPPNAPVTGHRNPPASALNFGDAQLTNPPISLCVNIPQITDDKSSGI